MPANAIVLDGSYVAQSGAGSDSSAYVFEQTHTSVFVLDSNVLQAVAFSAQTAAGAEIQVRLRDETDADAGADRFHGELQIVNDERTVDPHRLHAGGSGQAQVVPLLRVAEQHEAVAGQIGDPAGHARPAQIGARCEQRRVAAADVPGDERGVGQSSGAQRNVQQREKLRIDCLDQRAGRGATLPDLPQAGQQDVHSGGVAKLHAGHVHDDPRCRSGVGDDFGELAL